MNSFSLRNAVRDFTTAVLPGKVLEQERKVEAVINDDSTIYEGAVRNILIPWQRVEVSLSGAIEPGSNVARIPFPQGAKIRHVALTADTPPSSGGLEIRIDAGSESSQLAMQSGVQTMMAPFRLLVEPASWVVFDVMNAGGAADVTLTLHYEQRGGP